MPQEIVITADSTCDLSPDLIEKYNIPLDEYPRRCIKQIAEWEEEKNNILKDGKITHERSREYGNN